MGEVRHLHFESLSALLDGELQGQEAAEARAHLAACLLCRLESASLAHLEAELRLPPPLTCEAAAPLLSSVRDGEADDREGAIASRHLAGCAPCRQAQVSWTALEQALAGPLVLPSSRVDTAMRALAAQGARAPRGPRPTGAFPLGGVAWRGAVVAVIALAIAFGSTLAPARNDRPAATEPEPALVAAVQQVILHARTNTLYVAQPDHGAVNALDATTYALRARIAVGGRPTALALNDSANRLLVLDAATKQLSEIDVDRNTVVASTRLELTGTPTSVQVDNGKIIVSTVVNARAPTALAPATAASGGVAVFNSDTKKLETVSAVDVAPRLVVADPAGGRTLLVSAEATTVADASYRTMSTLVGGVGAAFGSRDRVAVLSADGEGAKLTFYGESSPKPARFDGRAAAVIGLPDGGFAVLLEVGGRGRIVIIDPSGEQTGEVALEASGRGLAYDAAAKKFSVVGGGQVASASLPAAVARGPSAATSGTPRASGTPAPSASAAASASPSASPTASPIVAARSSSAPSGSPLPSALAGVPNSVRVASDLYRVPLADARMPLLVVSTPSRVWFIDQRNQIAALDTATGAVYTAAELPRDARLQALAVGLTHVYAVDISKGRLFELTITTGRVASHALPLTDVSAVTVAPDGTVWIAMPGTSVLLAFHPKERLVESVDVGVRGALALAADSGGRLWFSDGRYAIGSFDRFANRLALLAWPGIRTPTVLLADDRGQVWAGTAQGEVHLLNAGQATLVTKVGRPITALAFDGSGQPWYLAPAAQGSGFAFGPARGAPARLVPGAATSLAVTSAGRTWLADPSGGFYLGTEEPR